MTDVHPRAIVSDEALLGEDVHVGPNAVIEAGVVVGNGTRVLAGSVLHRGTRLGERCRIGPYAVIGGMPPDRNFTDEESFVELGDDVVVFEFATIHRATGYGEVTRVGSGSMVMGYVHVAHNARVGERCILTNGVQLGGHAHIGARAVLGAAAMVHQFTRVGTLAMMSAGSSTNTDILPYALAHGYPARHLRANRVGLERNGFDADRRRTVEAALRHLRRKDATAFEALARADSDVAQMASFIAESRRGVARFASGS